MSPTDPTDTTPAQEPVAAPSAPDASGTGNAAPEGQTADAAPQDGAAMAPPAPPAAPRKIRKKAGKPGRKIGPMARSDAYRMLAEGVSCSAVARELKVRVDTVIVWRDSPEGEKEIRRLKELRNVELGATLREARKDLEMLIPRAIKALGDSLASSNPNVKVRAAAQILDRGGLPRTEVHEEHTGELDLSGLSPEELDQLRALHAKAARGAA